MEKNDCFETNDKVLIIILFSKINRVVDSLKRLKS